MVLDTIVVESAGGIVSTLIGSVDNKGFESSRWRVVCLNLRHFSVQEADHDRFLSFENADGPALERRFGCILV